MILFFVVRVNALEYVPTCICRAVRFLLETKWKKRQTKKCKPMLKTLIKMKDEETLQGTVSGMKACKFF